MLFNSSPVTNTLQLGNFTLKHSVIHYFKVSYCFFSNQVSQEELAKAQQKHTSVNMEEEVDLRTRMDDLHRELNEVKVR